MPDDLYNGNQVLLAVTRSMLDALRWHNKGPKPSDLRSPTYRTLRSLATRGLLKPTAGNGYPTHSLSAAGALLIQVMRRVKPPSP